MFKVVIENHNKGVNVVDFVQNVQTQLDTFRQNTELIDDVTFFALDLK